MLVHVLSKKDAYNSLPFPSVDSESWLCDWKNPHDRAEMHRAYERYVIEEAIPFIKHKTGWFDPMMTTGCSMGAYHALNFFLQHPDVFNKVVAP